MGTTRQCATDKKEMRGLVIEFHLCILAWFLYSLGPPSRDLVAYHLAYSYTP